MDQVTYNLEQTITVTMHAKASFLKFCLYLYNR